MKHKLIDEHTVACVSDFSDSHHCAGDGYGTPFLPKMLPMTEEQLNESESLYADGAMQRCPEQAARLALAAREGAAVTSDLPLIRRFTALATKLERIR